jgi:ABC-type polysaccharide/polyol phosphate transport system ATPase subunit
MSEPVLELCGVAKQYRIFRRTRYRLMDAFGLPVPQRSYDEVWALRGIDLSVRHGERLGIIGANGAGKSTLLRILAGLSRPTEGRVVMQGRIEALMELGTGFHPDFSGRENIFAALAHKGVTGVEAEHRFEDVVTFSELKEWIERPVSTYSAGMYTRLAFSVATAIRPEVLIVDEVLSAGDAYFTGKCITRMKQLAGDSGAAVVMVSHDLSALQALCQEAMWLDGGRVVAQGKVLEVIRRYVRHVKLQEDQLLRSRDRSLAAFRANVETGPGYGSGEIMITGVTLATKESRDVRNLVSLEPFEITVEWLANQLVHDAVFVFCVYLPSGDCATQWIASSKEMGAPVLAGRGTVAFRSNRLLLGHGQYVASIGIFRHKPERGVEPPAFHVLDRCVHFQVTNVDPTEAVQYGICRQEVVEELHQEQDQ